MSRKRIAMTPGTKYGKLTVLEDGYKIGDASACLCQCDCGNVLLVINADLRRGHNKSCGCARRSARGLSDNRIYKIYGQIKTRCYNKNHIHYKDYGGRGIGMCQEWLDSFLAFYDWSMENGYADDLTIDRIDNDKGYSPDNCRWVDAETQLNNTRFNAKLTYNGKTLSITQWARELGVSRDTLNSRYQHGWSAEEILSRPIRKRRA